MEIFCKLVGCDSMKRTVFSESKLLVILQMTHGAGLRLQGTSRDVLAIMHSIPPDRGDGPIGFLYGFRKIAATRGDSQHTTSGSLPHAVSLCRAGMKDKAF